MPLIKQTDNSEAEVILKYMNRMMENNKNYLNVTTGATGSGKSYSCLRVAELWYAFYFKKEFPKENICFSVEDLIRRLNSGELKKGDVLVVEEIGVGANAKNFQSKTNKALQFILQSFRNLNIIVLFNVPHFSFFDKTARMLMHSHFQTVKINKRKGICILKPYFLNISQQTGKIYTKWLRIKNHGKVVKITRLNIAKPSQYLLDVYEDMKDRFVKTLIKGLEVSIAVDIQPKEQLKPMTPRQKAVFDYASQGKTTNEIAELMGLPAPTISHQKRYLRKKGYMWEVTPETKEKVNKLIEIEQIA